MALVLLVLAACLVAALAWFVDNADPYDHSGELVSQGGKYGSPLAPGDTARYRDGLRVTVGKARRVPNLPGDVALKEGELTYEYAVTYVTDLSAALSSGREVGCGEAAVDEVAAVLDLAEAVTPYSDEVVGVGEGCVGLAAASQQ